LPGIAWLVLLIVTLAFAAIDYGLMKFRLFEKWDPRSLPPLDRQSGKVPRATSITGIVIQLVFTVWWFGLPNFPDLILGQLRPAPIWQTLYLPVLFIAIAILAQNVVTLVRPHWTWVPRAVGLLTSIASLVILYLLLQTQELVSFEGINRTALTDLKVGKLNTSLHLAVLFTWIGILIAALVEAVKCLRLGRDLVSGPGHAPASRS